MNLNKIAKLSVGDLNNIKAATQEKIATIDNRRGSSNEEVNAAFAKTRSDLAGQVAAIDAELARRS